MRTKPLGTYAIINLDHIVHNYLEISKWTGDDVTVSCVVKSDAYGHGELPVVQALVVHGVQFICVSTVIEGVRLRKQYPDLEILILGYTPVHAANSLIEYNLIQSIGTWEEAQRYNTLGDIRVHLNINTGMNRLGLDAADVEMINQIYHLKHIHVEGIYTHLHSSDGIDPSLTENQFQLFQSLLRTLRDRGISTGTCHICNSGGAIRYPHMHMDMVRLGISLYGLYPSHQMKKSPIQLKECMELHSYVARIHQLPQGQGISYGHTYIADRNMQVATVNLGYSDGVFRQLSNVGEVLIQGQRCKIIGRVCMNMIMVDVTGMENVAVEDEVVLFGRQGDSMISIDEVADWAGTISYDVVCRTGYSVPRIYLHNGEIVQMETDAILRGIAEHNECR